MQDILDTGKFNWPGQGECEAWLWAGGDSPWSRRWMGVSTASQVGSIHNEAVLRGTGKNRRWVGAGQRRTEERQAAHYVAFVAGAKSLDVAGCSTKPLLRISHRRVVECILHLAMAMGRIQAAWVQLQAKALALEDRASLQEVLRQHKTGLCVKGSTSVDGEEAFRLFGAWEDICEVLRPCKATRQAVLGMRALLSALYVSFQDPTPPQCAPVAQAYRRAICPNSKGHYLLFLEEDCQHVLADIYPYGMAMFSGDVVESLNRLLKKGFNDHSDRGAQLSDGLEGLIDAQGRVVGQVWEWVFLYFDIPLVRTGRTRTHACRAQKYCEGNVVPSRTPPRPRTPSSNPPSTHPIHPSTPDRPAPRAGSPVPDGSPTRCLWDIDIDSDTDTDIPPDPIAPPSHQPSFLTPNVNPANSRPSTPGGPPYLSLPYLSYGCLFPSSLLWLLLKCGCVPGCLVHTVARPPFLSVYFHLPLIASYHGFGRPPPHPPLGVPRAAAVGNGGKDPCLPGPGHGPLREAVSAAQLGLARGTCRTDGGVSTGGRGLGCPDPPPSRSGSGSHGEAG